MGKGKGEMQGDIDNMNFGNPDEDRIYPCADCGKLRTQDEGGTTFTVCEECWDKIHRESSQRERLVARFAGRKVSQPSADADIIAANDKHEVSKDISEQSVTTVEGVE